MNPKRQTTSNFLFYYFLILQAYLEMTIEDNSKIRKQDASSALRSVCRNRIGRDVAWDWLRSEYDRIRAYFGPKLGIGGPIEDMVVIIASDFNSNFKLTELEEFYNEHIDDFGTNNMVIKKAIQKVKANINWMDNNYATIVEWLQNRDVNLPTKAH